MVRAAPVTAPWLDISKRKESVNDGAAATPTSNFSLDSQHLIAPAYSGVRVECPSAVCVPRSVDAHWWLCTALVTTVPRLQFEADCESSGSSTASSARPKAHRMTLTPLAFWLLTVSIVFFFFSCCSKLPLHYMIRQKASAALRDRRLVDLRRRSTLTHGCRHSMHDSYTSLGLDAMYMQSGEVAQASRFSCTACYPCVYVYAG